MTQLPLWPESANALRQVLPPKLEALRLPLGVVMAILDATENGARIIHPADRSPFYGSDVLGDVELILAAGQDRTRLKAAGFRTGEYPWLRRAIWRRV